MERKNENLNHTHEPQDSDEFTIADMTDEEVDQFAKNFMQLMATKKSKPKLPENNTYQTRRGVAWRRQ